MTQYEIRQEFRRSIDQGVDIVEASVRCMENYIKHGHLLLPDHQGPTKAH